MKIAISGKGGVGKTTLSALLIKYSGTREKGPGVDATPTPTCSLALGVTDPENIVPLSQMKEMVGRAHRIRARQDGRFFKLNPKVDDIPEKYSRQIDGIKLIVMGGDKKAESGLYLPGERAAAHPDGPHGAAP